MQVRNQQLELEIEQQTFPNRKKEYVKAVYCHPAYLRFKIAQRNINNLRYADDTTLMVEIEEELKGL